MKAAIYKIGVIKIVEIINCHFNVFSIFSTLSTIIIFVANKDVMIQASIPKEEIIKG